MQQQTVPTMTPEQVRARAAIVNSIFECLPRDITIYDALDALLSAYVTAGIQTKQLPTITAGLKATLRGLEEGLNPGQHLPIDIAQEASAAANGLVRALRAVIPDGMPHHITMSALLGLFHTMAVTHTCCIGATARNVRACADELEALADGRGRATTH